MINTLWNIRTEALMLEEGLSTILIAPLTGEVKDVGVNEVVGLASDDETEVVENASDDCCFHGVNPFFPWRSSLGVMPYALGVTILAGNPLSVAKQWTLRILFGLDVIINTSNVVPKNSAACVYYGRNKFVRVKA